MSDDRVASLRVRVKPNARRAGILGWQGDAVKVAVVATPERGQANAELIGILAAALDLPRSAFEIVAGTASRNKRLVLEGITVGELQARLSALLGDGGAGGARGAGSPRPPRS